MMCNINHFYPNRQYLKQNMPTFTGNKIEKEKKMAMYIMLD